MRLERRASLLVRLATRPRHGQAVRELRAGDGVVHQKPRAVEPSGAWIGKCFVDTKGVSKSGISHRLDGVGRVIHAPTAIGAREAVYRPCEPCLERRTTLGDLGPLNVPRRAPQDSS